MKRIREKRPLPGDAIGEIILPSLDKHYFVVEGTDTDNLRKGPGHYPDTPLPGERGTVAIAGHRTTYGAPFRHIDELERGQRIILSMPYGRFVYRVEKTQIVDDSALWITDPGRLRPAGAERLPSALQRGAADRGVRAARRSGCRRRCGTRSGPRPVH